MHFLSAYEDRILEKIRSWVFLDVRSSKRPWISSDPHFIHANPFGLQDIQKITSKFLCLDVKMSTMGPDRPFQTPLCYPCHHHADLGGTGHTSPLQSSYLGTATSSSWNIPNHIGKCLFILKDLAQMSLPWKPLLPNSSSRLRADFWDYTLDYNANSIFHIALEVICLHASFFH